MSNPTGGSHGISEQYVAGFFDGEGCITTQMQWIQGKYEKYPRVCLQVTIANTDLNILKLIENWFCGKIHKCSTSGRMKRCYQWRITGKEAMMRFLNTIRPYVAVKKDQVELALEFCDTLRDENLGCVPLSKKTHAIRKRIHDELRRLKH